MYTPGYLKIIVVYYAFNMLMIIAVKMRSFAMFFFVIPYGISFGTALAIAISFTVNKSILWAILHGIFSWLYVLYYAITRKN